MRTLLCATVGLNVAAVGFAATTALHLQLRGLAGEGLAEVPPAENRDAQRDEEGDQQPQVVLDGGVNRGDDLRLPAGNRRPTGTEPANQKRSEQVKQWERRDGDEQPARLDEDGRGNHPDCEESKEKSRDCGIAIGENQAGENDGQHHQRGRPDGEPVRR